MDLKIISLNVWGLEMMLREERCLIGCEEFYMLQEVDCTENTNHLWSSELGYQAIFSSCKSNRAGVCLLFNNNFNLQIQKLHSDPLGHFFYLRFKS